MSGDLAMVVYIRTMMLMGGWESEEDGGGVIININGLQNCTRCVLCWWGVYVFEKK